VGDRSETEAIKSVFGDHASRLHISAMKSQIGHLLGGAGGVETVACVQSLVTGVVTPTLNFEHPGEGCDLDYVPGSARQADPKVILKNSFGFGGQNAVLVLRKFEG
jgi:3-oxoacyl-[acyl-carrier-protein] synthase II